MKISATGLEFEDCYETLGVSPNADQETIQAAYRFLAKRYHPDNAQTGDGQRFISVRKAYRTLSDSELRSIFDSKHRSLGLQGQRWVGARAPLKIEEDEYIRKALLWLLYRSRRRAVDEPGVGDLDLESSLGCSESELSFHLWYLKEKGWVERTDTGGYAITADGVDRVTQGIVLRADRLLTKLTGAQQGEDDPVHGEGSRIAGQAGQLGKGLSSAVRIQNRTSAMKQEPVVAQGS